jgi:hypothetical protein
MRRTRGRHARHARPTTLIPARRWPRRLLVSTNLLAVLGLIVVGAAYGYTRWRLDQIKTVAAPHLTKVTKVDSSGGLPAENILLIGNQTRA